MNLKIENLIIENVEAFDNEKYNGFVIEWSTNIGFGECNVFREKTDKSGKWFASTECMCNNENKSFLKMLLDKLVDTTDIVE